MNQYRYEGCDCKVMLVESAGGQGYYRSCPQHGGELKEVSEMKTDYILIKGGINNGQAEDTTY